MLIRQASLISIGQHVKPQLTKAYRPFFLILKGDLRHISCQVLILHVITVFCRLWWMLWSVHVLIRLCSSGTRITRARFTHMVKLSPSYLKMYKIYYMSRVMFAGQIKIAYHRVRRGHNDRCFCFCAHGPVDQSHSRFQIKSYGSMNQSLLPEWWWAKQPPIK